MEKQISACSARIRQLLPKVSLPFSSPTHGPEFVQWGAPDDTVLPNDYDGDGKTDFMIFRPSGALTSTIF
jgi:hypothetical protein